MSPTASRKAKPATKRPAASKKTAVKKKAIAKKKATTKTSASASPRKAAASKSPARKPAVKKVLTKRAAKKTSKRSAATRKATPAKRAATKKVVRKAAPKSPVTRGGRSVARKAPARKSAVRASPVKTTAKQVSARKSTVKQVSALTGTAKQPSVRKGPVTRQRPSNVTPTAARTPAASSKRAEPRPRRPSAAVAKRHFQEALEAKQERTRQGPAYPPANAFTGRPEASVEPGHPADDANVAPVTHSSPSPEAAYVTNLLRGRGNQGMRKQR